MLRNLAQLSVGSDDLPVQQVVQVRPNARLSKPKPPPSVTPLIPTEGHDPPGSVAPAPASAALISISCAPAPIVAVPAAC